MRRGGRPVVSAAPALGHIEHLVSMCPGATPTYICRLAGVSTSALPRARRSGNMEVETVERFLHVREEHMRLLPPPLVPVGPAREHIERLIAESGLPGNAVARAVGISAQTVGNILGRSKRTQHIVKYAVHAAILATTADHVRGVDYWTDRHASTVRLRALQANGWSLTMLGEAYGMNLTNLAVQPDESPIQTRVARRIERLYETIGDQPGTSARSATVARGLGYFPPIYYDEDMNPVEVTETFDEAQEEARTDLCILGLTVEHRSVASIAVTLGVQDRRVSRVRRAAGLRIERSFDGGYKAADDRPGAAAAIREVVRRIHYRSTIDMLDEPGLDYVALLASLTTSETSVTAA